MVDLRARVRAQTAPVATSNGHRVRLTGAVVRSRTRLESIRRAIQKLGDPPPAPPTLRGRIGAMGVRTVRRTLFWLIPEIKTVEEEVTACLEEELRVIEQLVDSVERLDRNGSPPE